MRERKRQYKPIPEDLRKAVKPECTVSYYGSAVTEGNKWKPWSWKVRLPSMSGRDLRKVIMIVQRRFKKNQLPACETGTIFPSFRALLGAPWVKLKKVRVKGNRPTRITYWRWEGKRRRVTRVRHQ